MLHHVQAFFRTPLGWLVLALLLIYLFMRFRANASLNTGDSQARIAAAITPVVPTGQPSPWEG